MSRNPQHLSNMFPSSPHYQMFPATCAGNSYDQHDVRWEKYIMSFSPHTYTAPCTPCSRHPPVLHAGLCWRLYIDCSDKLLCRCPPRPPLLFYNTHPTLLPAMDTHWHASALLLEASHLGPNQMFPPDAIQPQIFLLLGWIPEGGTSQERVEMVALFLPQCKKWKVNDFTVTAALWASYCRG